MKPRRRISEEEARRLFARAVEIEAREGSYFSLDELREVAREAGIPPEALDQAVAELDQGVLRSPTVGRSLAEKLERSRRLACALGFIGVAAVSPGDMASLTLVGGLSFYGLWEGMIALARLLGGSSPPSGPSQPTEMSNASRSKSDSDQDRSGLEFFISMVLRRTAHAS